MNTTQPRKEFDGEMNSGGATYMPTSKLWSGAVERLEKQIESARAARALAPAADADSEPEDEETQLAENGPPPPAAPTFPPHVPARTSPEVKRVKAFMLSPEIDLTVDQQQVKVADSPPRKDLELVYKAWAHEGSWRNAVDKKVKMGETAMQSYENLLLSTFIKPLQEEVISIMKTADARVDEWVARVVAYLGKKLPLKQGGDAGKYEDDCLYIVTMPEFGFNGYMQKGKFFADASRPIPTDLEGLVAIKLRKALTDNFGYLRVLFAFSCCSYSSELLYQAHGFKDEYDRETVGGWDTSKKTGRWLFGIRKLGGYNRITVVTSSNAPLRGISKMFTADADEWVKRKGESAKKAGTTVDKSLFSKANVLQHPRYREDITSNRFKEITVDMADMFGDKGVSLRFVTCLDIETHINPDPNPPKDTEPKDEKYYFPVPCNLSVFLGGGMPLEKLKDDKHNFIYNDTKCYTLIKEKNNQYLPGYHIIEKTVNENAIGIAWYAPPDSVLDRAVLQPTTRTNFSGNNHPDAIAWDTDYFVLPPAQ